MIHFLFLIPAFLFGYIACYFYMTSGVDQDGVWISKREMELD